MATLTAVLADVGGTGAASHVTAGAVLTLVIPLALLVLVLAWWWLSSRRGWPARPTERHPARSRHRRQLRQRDE